MAVACGGGGESVAEPPPAAAESERERTQSVAPAAAPIDDPSLEPYLLRNDPALPPRFREVPPDGREPIISLGLLSGAARISYSSPTTDERLSIDALRLEEGLDARAFFATFAGSLAEHSEFRGVRTIGVLRGLGERARRYAFTVGGDVGEAVALLRDGVVVLVTYLRPDGLRQPVDVGALLTALDERIQADAALRPGGAGAAGG